MGVSWRAGGVMECMSDGVSGRVGELVGEWEVSGSGHF